MDIGFIRKDRIYSIDYLRGVIMIIMALDHVRDFFHVTAQTANPLDLSTTTTFLFFTRWITHFCAPTFVFLSGVSAYLSGRNKSLKIISSLLIKRGAWLVIIDAVIISFGLTFNPAYNFVMLTVFWAIGCSMILLGLVLRLSPKLVLPLGLLLFIGHDLVSSVSLQNNGAIATILKILFMGLYVTPITSSHSIGFIYAVLPWTGVMLLGYGFGKYVTDKRTVFTSGLSLLALFVLLRTLNTYGDPKPWQIQNNLLYSILSFVNTTKYPPSLQFLLMTLGPALLLLAGFQQMHSRFLKFFSVYGRVPFFYYVLHLFLVHVLLAITFFITGHSLKEISDPQSPFLFRPHYFGFSLPIVYGIWLIVVLSLYFPCRWYDRFKTNNKKWWTRYV